MRSCIWPTRSLAFVVMMQKVRIHSSVCGIFQFNRRQGKGLACFHGDGIGLFRLLSLDRLPLEEVVHGHQTATPFVAVAERRQRGDGFGFGVDGLPTATCILAPIGDQTPPEQIACGLAGLGVLPDDPMFLARRAVVARRRLDPAVAAVAHDRNEAGQFAGLLSDASTHRS